MVNDDLARLRAEVRKRRSAVTAKEARIKRNTGVQIANTGQDPRRPIKVVERYNQRQLRTYLNELNAFMDRGNNYVAGAGAAPIPKTKWQEYKRLEKRYNSIGKTHFQKIADIFIPQAGMTIAQRDATMRPDSIRAQGDIIHRPYSNIERDARNINGEKALDKLMASMKAKISREFLPGQIKEARKQLNQMLTTLGNNELINKARDLTDSQFDTLWNYTNFATNVSGIYFIMQSKTVSSEDRWYSSVVEDYGSDIRELFDWASSLPATQNNSARRGKGGKKK